MFVRADPNSVSLPFSLHQSSSLTFYFPLFLSHSCHTALGSGALISSSLQYILQYRTLFFFVYLSKVVLQLFYFRNFLHNFFTFHAYFSIFYYLLFSISCSNFFAYTFSYLNYFHNVFFLNIFQISFMNFFQKFSFKFLSQIFVQKLFCLGILCSLLSQNFVRLVYSLNFLSPTIFYSNFYYPKYILEIFVS